jgi:glucokinase
MVMYFLLLLISSISTYGYDPLELKTYVKTIPQNINCYIGADVGGTYSRFGIFQAEENIPTLLFSLHTQTKTITDFTKVVSDVIAYAQDNYGITIHHACIAAPGVTTKNKDFSSVHGLFDIKSKKIIKKSNLTAVYVVNDLFVVGHGLNFMGEDKIVQLYGSAPKPYATRAFVGVGTGLGSSTMTWNEKTEVYTANSSEAGLLEFSPNNHDEYDIANHIKQMWDGKNPICWANLVSGSGIRRIYSILKLTNKYHDSLRLDTHDPAVIFANPEDALCKATINLFGKLFARFVRNYVFATLPYGGLYITGGVAAKNVPFFSGSFVSEYENCGRIQEILKDIPIYLIADSTISLYGAVKNLLLEMG